MRLLYFAWVRERVGKAEESIELPSDVRTVGELMAHLARQGDNYASAFGNSRFIRAAVDRAHVRHDAPIHGAGEIAFFPPMTGG